jgi:NADH dehydrogenase FAD-containing subunit
MLTFFKVQGRSALQKSLLRAHGPANVAAPTSQRSASTGSSCPKVVIIGAGFAGLEAARALSRAKVDVLLLDKKNHHCFQPLLYQVATAALSPADVAWPIRSILAEQENISVIMADVCAIDTQARIVSTKDGDRFTYDFS